MSAMREAAELQEKYANLARKSKLTKKAMCVQKIVSKASRLYCDECNLIRKRESARKCYSAARRRRNERVSMEIVVRWRRLVLLCNC